MDDKIIEVCDNCLKASCWHGEFMCDNSCSAGTKLKTIAELKKLALENKEYWSNKKMKEIYGEKNPYGYKMEGA